MVRLYCSQGGSNAALRAALMWLCWRFYCGLCGGSNAALRAALMWLCWRFYCGLCGGSNAALRAVLMRFRGLS